MTKIIIPLLLAALFGLVLTIAGIFMYMSEKHPQFYKKYVLNKDMSEKTYTILTDSMPDELIKIIEQKKEEISIKIVKANYLKMSEMMADNKYDAVVTSHPSLAEFVDKDSKLLKNKIKFMSSPYIFAVREDIAVQLEDGSLKDFESAKNSTAKFHLGIKYPSPAKSSKGALIQSLLAENSKPTLNYSKYTSVENFVSEISQSYQATDLFISEEADYARISDELADNIKFISVPAGFSAVYEIFATDKNPDSFTFISEYLLSEEFQKKAYENGYKTITNFKPEIENAQNINKLAKYTLNHDTPDIQKVDVALGLNFYKQTALKPAFNIFLIDYSSSMSANKDKIISAVYDNVYFPNSYPKFFRDEKDVNVFIPFNFKVIDPKSLIYTIGYKDGEDKSVLEKLKSVETEGSTNIYHPVSQALYVFAKYSDEMPNYRAHAFLISDTKISAGSITDITEYWKSLNADFALPPVFSIGCDRNNPALNEISEFTGGKYFYAENCDYKKALKEALFEGIK